MVTQKTSYLGLFWLKIKKNYMGYRKYSLSSFQQDIAEGSSFSRLEIKAKRRWKCYQIMNVAYGLTKIFKARLCSLEKAKTI